MFDTCILSRTLKTTEWIHSFKKVEKLWLRVWLYWRFSIVLRILNWWRCECVVFLPYYRVNWIKLNPTLAWNVLLYLWIWWVGIQHDDNTLQFLRVLNQRDKSIVWIVFEMNVYQFLWWVYATRWETFRQIICGADQNNGIFFKHFFFFGRILRNYFLPS